MYKRIRLLSSSIKNDSKQYHVYKSQITKNRIKLFDTKYLPFYTLLAR